MKLYATTTSERASKGQGGNDYLETLYNIADKDQATFRVRVINDEKMGQIYFTVENFFFGNWRTKYETVIYTNVTSKGNKQKGEKCNDCDLGVTEYPTTKEGTCSYCNKKH